MLIQIKWDGKPNPTFCTHLKFPNLSMIHPEEEEKLTTGSIIVGSACFSHGIVWQFQDQNQDRVFVV